MTARSEMKVFRENIHKVVREYKYFPERPSFHYVREFSSQ